MPPAGLTLGGLNSSSNRTITVTPATNRSGTATITVTFSSQTGSTATRSFTVTVSRASANVTVNTSTVIATVGGFAAGSIYTISGDLVVSVVQEGMIRRART